MNARYIALLTVISLSVAEACDTNVDDGKDLSYEEAARQEVVYPELDTFMPEEDVPSQRKSPKRGICTNFRHRDATGAALMPSILGEGVSWCYNWAHSPLDAGTWATLLDNGMTFYPMVWNAGFSQQNLATFIATDPNSDYVLAYNEPNLTDQANMTPAAAAAAWPGFVQAARSLGLKIVGPAVNYGTLSGYNDPVVWYDEFLAQPGVSLDDIDAIALHSYMPGGEALKTLMIRKFKKYGKPIWLTEYANGEAGSVEAQQQFCQESTIYLEADPMVEKYAWFMDSTGSSNPPHFPMISNDATSVGGSPSAITDLGRLYIGLSTFDKDNYYNVDVNIPAEHYSGQVVEETAGLDNWGEYVETNLTTDVYGNLEIRNLSGTKWVEYNVDIPATSKYRIDLRYRSSMESVIKIDCEGAVSAVASLEPSMRYSTTGAITSYWTTTGVEMTLPAGKNTVRLTVPTGSINLNWLRFTSPLAE